MPHPFFWRMPFCEPTHHFSAALTPSAPLRHSKHGSAGPKKKLRRHHTCVFSIPRDAQRMRFQPWFARCTRLPITKQRGERTSPLMEQPDATTQHGSVAAVAGAHKKSPKIKDSIYIYIYVYIYIYKNIPGSCNRRAKPIGKKKHVNWWGTRPHACSPGTSSQRRVWSKIWKQKNRPLTQKHLTNSGPAVNVGFIYKCLDM